MCKGTIRLNSFFQFPDLNITRRSQKHKTHVRLGTTECEELAMEKFIPFVLGAQRPLMSSVDIDKALIKIDEVTNIQEHYTSFPRSVDCWSVCPMAVAC
ncbi:hypothetical protein PILCRDRAFT_826096 [Piloderma croceum F 1598]|uniref:Uncharacterized protein n=1 Tax=Piloderma croceum (strain F 1598) TaxID=765440 RepID=A0A0C3FAE2_PILCF|nr:hypothetical protein PILCRDRAFT_826096 [Piloderma croceum F 1598]